MNYNYYRGQRVRFEAKFEGTPAPGYPTFKVTAPDGRLVATGTGSKDPADPTVYYATVVIPADAPVGGGWRIHWEFKDVNGKESAWTQDFEVFDVVLAEADTRAQQSIALVGRPFRTFIRFLDPPESIKAMLLDPETDQPVNGKSYLYPGELKQVPDLDTYLYVLQDTLSEIRSVVVLWEYQPTSDPTLGPYYQYEMLHIIPLRYVPLFTSLRHLIDKFQKTFGTRRAYEDAELLEYLERGLDLLNLYHPITTWNGVALPRELETFWIMAAAWYALNAQYLLEGDAAFDYSGLSVTLNVDRTGYIESELERLKAKLDEDVPKVKSALVRRANAGLVAGRGMRPIPQYRFVGTWRRPRIVSVNY